MPLPKLEDQAQEIVYLCNEAGLTQDEMAERIALKPDSMRKIAKGYQPCSEQLLQSMRNVAVMEKLKRGESPVLSGPGVMVNPDIQKNLQKSSEQTKRQGVQRVVPPERKGLRVNYQIEELAGVVTQGNVYEKATKELKEIADSDPDALRAVANVISTYRKTVRKSKKGKT